MLLVTVAAGAPTPSVNAQGKIPLYPVQMTAPIPGNPPPKQPPAPVSAYVGPAGAGFPGPAVSIVPALLGPPPKVSYATY